MTRALRLQFEGAFYHIMNRGLGSQNIFLNPNHKKLFLDLLAEITEKYKIEVHAYCLMNNHYHLLVKINLLNLNMAMKHLNGVYTIRFNREVKRDGPLFRGRYKSILIDKDSYLLNVSRYIHKNPSKAKIIEDDKKYKWSSYQYYCDLSGKPSWLFCDQSLKYFNNDNKKYINFIDDEIDDETKSFYSSKNIKSILGKKEFIKEVADNSKDELFNKDLSNRNEIIIHKYLSAEELMEKLVQDHAISKDLIFKSKSKHFNYERNLFIYLLMQNPRYNLKQKAEFLNVSDDAITKSFKRFIEKLNLNRSLMNKVEQIKSKIYE